MRKFVVVVLALALFAGHAVAAGEERMSERKS